MGQSVHYLPVTITGISCYLYSTGDGAPGASVPSTSTETPEEAAIRQQVLVAALDAHRVDLQRAEELEAQIDQLGEQEKQRLESSSHVDGTTWPMSRPVQPESEFF